MHSTYKVVNDLLAEIPTTDPPDKSPARDKDGKFIAEPVDKFKDLDQPAFRKLMSEDYGVTI